MKVLNALGQLGLGGGESSLVDVLRHLDRDEIQMDFLVTSAFEGFFDSAVKEMGSRILLGKERFSPGRNLRELAEINERFGPYHALHSHRGFGGAPLLKAAQQVGIPIRVAHGQRIREDHPTWIDRTEMAIARHMTRKYCTHGLAVSRAAAVSLFGPRWERDPRMEVLPFGCDFEAFRDRGSRDRVRRELDMGDDEIAVIHVGGFEDTGVYEFILSVAVALDRLPVRFRFLLVGDGPFLEHVKWQIRLAGLSGRVVFLGTQPDLPELLSGMDVFMLPATVEEFSLSAVKAQAAGLACFLGELVVPEVDVVPELLQRIPLEDGPEVWAEAIAAHSRAPLSQDRALDQCLASPLGIGTFVERLSRIYSGA